MNVTRKVTKSNAQEIEKDFSRIVNFSIGEDGKPEEVSIMHPNQKTFIIIRPGSFSGSLSVEITEALPTIVERPSETSEVNQ